LGLSKYINFYFDHVEISGVTVGRRSCHWVVWVCCICMCRVPTPDRIHVPH